MQVRVNTQTSAAQNKLQKANYHFYYTQRSIKIKGAGKDKDAEGWVLV